jgi:hypothetical protein
MAYSLAADVRAMTGINNSTYVSDAYITLRIAAADGIINGKVGDVYSVPLASAPDLIKFLSIEIASALIYMGEYSEELQGEGIKPEKKLNAAIKILDGIQEQGIKLYDGDGVEFTRVDLLTPTGYPDEAASEAGGAAEPAFTMDQQF